jgi:hypothetical protein
MVRLCYPNRHQTKGKVENSIKFVRSNFFNGREFSSLQDINTQFSQWLEKVNSRVNGTTGRIPIDLLNEEHLHPVDAIPEFIYIIKTERKVSRERFEGLLKALKQRNMHNYGIEVEKRNLKEYEVV